MIPNDALSRLQHSPLDVITLRCSGNEVRFTLQGAHVVSYLSQGIERLWLSPKSEFKQQRPIRGGVPICWPWFGPHPEDESQPAHGFARTTLWTLADIKESAQRAEATLTLSSEHPDYPLVAEYQIVLTPSQLSLKLTTRNLSTDPIKLSEALHTYLPVSDLETAALHGLQHMAYADKLLEYRRATEERESVYLTEPTDRVYFESGEQLQLIDSGWQRVTTIAKAGSGATVVWNAGEKTATAMLDLGAENYRSYICVEAANALDASITLQPGASNTLSQSLS